MLDRLARRSLETGWIKVGRAFRALGRRLNEPLIILGTGRAGTNLVEDILNSHPGIRGYPGEANRLWHPLLEPFETTPIDIPPIEIDPEHFTRVSLSTWPDGQENKIHDAFSGFSRTLGLGRRFFCKSAMISFMIPKICEIFPDVKILHMYRFGPAVVESYFKKNFGKYSRYDYSPQQYYEHCARYWNDCLLEIDRSVKATSLRERAAFLELSYEALCDRPSETLRTLSEFIHVEDLFKFPLSRIENMNYKVGDFEKNGKWRHLIEIMEPAMRLKGYI